MKTKRFKLCQMLILGLLTCFCFSVTSCSTSSTPEEQKEQEEDSPEDVVENYSNICIVVWKNSEGNTFKVEKYKKGEIPSYKWEEPTKPETYTHTYNFKSWTPEIKPLEGNKVFYPVFEEIEKPKEAAIIFDLTPEISMEGKNFTFSCGEGEVTNIIWGDDSSFEENVYSHSYNQSNNYTIKIFGELTNFCIDNSTCKLSKCIKKITVNYNLKSFANLTFPFLENLETLNINSPLTSLPTDFCKNASSLTNVTLPNNLEKIGDWCFYGCRALKFITIPDTLKEFGFYAFGNCEALEELYVPKNVTRIGEAAFFNCCSATTLTFLPETEVEYYQEINSVNSSLLRFDFSIVDLKVTHASLNILKTIQLDPCVSPYDPDWDTFTYSQKNIIYLD